MQSEPKAPAAGQKPGMLEMYQSQSQQAESGQTSKGSTVKKIAIYAAVISTAAGILYAANKTDKALLERTLSILKKATVAAGAAYIVSDVAFAPMNMGSVRYGIRRLVSDWVPLISPPHALPYHEEPRKQS
ncbi:hypothetical protein [Parendozoicomonas haliclonae]|uniref:Uncharacterized protein n=1 Tax=Parendozoicomonas haliclonae TaxID=1960125 RepID=A0A1X7AQ27_9GAMM|nr:hypothetical protein [Parendozoicomonas haliclonae]SMA50345.1 hypothetical protein EHSB41UT_04142 [Parendozoicomonas haliclonae]